MAVASAKFEAGQALLPERAPWLADLEAELFVFPGSWHDDSQALLDKNISFMTWLTPEDWERLIAKSRTTMRRSVLLRLIRASLLQDPLDQVPNSLSWIFRFQRRMFQLGAMSAGSARYVIGALTGILGAMMAAEVIREPSQLLA